LEVFKSVQPLVQKLIKALATNNRIAILAEISEEYISLYNTQHHIQYASVITAAK